MEQHKLVGTYRATADIPDIGHGIQVVEDNFKLCKRENQIRRFHEIDLVYDNAVASVKVAQQAKSEGDLVITGTKGYVYVPAPWWKTDYFEVRYENIEENKRYFYPLDGEGIRYEIVSFSRAIDSDKNTSYISENVSVAIAKIMEQFYSGDVILIK